MKDLSKVIELNPHDADDDADRGFTYKEKCGFFRAIQEYSKAIRIDPRKEFYESRAGVYRKIGLNAEAASDINKAKQLAK
jgi:tetratricopeptide (TPR) repeat protein